MNACTLTIRLTFCLSGLDALPRRSVLNDCPDAGAVLSRFSRTLASE